MTDLDSLIHQPTRLRIMAALVSLEEAEQLEFSLLQRILELTPGNLSVHLQKLEEARYVHVKKEFVQRRPKTWIAASARGRAAFAGHVAALKEIVDPPLAP